VVTVRTADGRYRDLYLGTWGTAASRAEYQRVCAVLAANAGVYPSDAPDVTINEVLLAYFRHAEAYYRRPDGSPTSSLATVRLVARAVRTLFGPAPAADFGVRELLAVRTAMVAAGLTRREVNRRVGVVRRLFRWAAAEGMVPPAVFQALGAVEGLRAGRTDAADPEPVGPVAADVVERTLPHLRPEVAAMVRVQQLTGCRPQDVCGIRPRDVDTSGAVWLYKPSDHKGAWRGRLRTVAIGPRAQAVLREFWPADPGEYVFSPRRAVERLHAERAAARTTPRYPSHEHRNRSKRGAPGRRPGARYATHAYDHAIARAAAKAGVPHWSPNQLRHAAGTLVRERFGLEAAQVYLGHARADVTQVYAARNEALAVRVAAEFG
jgi:integrase